ncbi:MAG: hypothetical protein JWR83_1259 [Aeromicrobium sp.]|nr:hypothetical protein [Aeromicrobium sp.]
MEIRRLAELTTVDERVRRSGPIGFNLAGMMVEDDTVAFEQHVIAAADLHPDVPEDVRSAFERLRHLHVYGAFHYEFFTLVYDHAPLVLEQALAARFAYFYVDGIPLVTTAGATEVLEFESFSELFPIVRRGGPHAKSKLKSADGTARRVPINVGELLAWARAERLLEGQRNRWMDQVTVRHRNRVAHPTGYHLVMPNDSARAIWGVAETINKLWGQSTPGGRLYPAPIERLLVIVAGNGQGTLEQCRPFHLEDPKYREGWTFTVVLAVPTDDVFAYDPSFETTSFPMEMLLQSESYDEVLAWLDAHGDLTDTTTYLDRLFLIRQTDSHLEWARRPDVAFALSGDDRDGIWHAVRADVAGDAVAHVRRLLAQDGGGLVGVWADERQPDCIDRAPCRACPAESVLTGSLDDVHASVSHTL